MHSRYLSVAQLRLRRRQRALSRNATESDTAAWIKGVHIRVPDDHASFNFNNVLVTKVTDSGQIYVEVLEQSSDFPES